MRWIIDAHAHLEDEAFAGNLEEIIARLPQEGVLAVINPGCDYETSKQAVEMAHEYKNIFACVGTHPHEARFYDQDLEGQYRLWADDDRVVAIGEIGLDYHYDFSPRKKQQEVFEAQLQLAKDVGLPIVVHTREAIDDTHAILKNFGLEHRGLMHAFGETVEYGQRFLDMGFSLSLGGMVTFKNAKNPKALAEWVPADRLLVETDAPYLAPVPKRGKRNEPAYTHYSLEEMARLRGDELDELANQVLENTIKFYGIEKEIQALRDDYEKRM